MVQPHSYNRKVKVHALLALLILLMACNKGIRTKEAVRQGVIDHLAKRSDLMSMDVSVESVSFREDEADATVYLRAGSGPAAGNGMQMHYLLDRKGNKWVVRGRGSMGASDNPHGAGSPTMPGMPGQTPALPPGHPQVPAQPGPPR